MEYAGFWQRVIARFLDVFILTFVAVLISLVLNLMTSHSEYNSGMPIEQRMLWIIAILLMLIYDPIFVSSSSKATPGKMAVGISLVRGNSETVGFGIALVRRLIEAAMVYLPPFIFMFYFIENKPLNQNDFGLIGAVVVMCAIFIVIVYALQLTTEKRQTLYDLMSDTVVVKKSSILEHAQIKDAATGAVGASVNSSDAAADKSLIKSNKAELSSNVSKNNTLGAFLFLFLGLGVAFIFYYFNNPDKFKKSEDIEDPAIVTVGADSNSSDAAAKKYSVQEESAIVAAANEAVAAANEAIAAAKEPDAASEAIAVANAALAQGSIQQGVPKSISISPSNIFGIVQVEQTQNITGSCGKSEIFIKNISVVSDTTFAGGSVQIVSGQYPNTKSLDVELSDYNGMACLDTLKGVRLLTWSNCSGSSCGDDYTFQLIDPTTLKYDAIPCNGTLEKFSDEKCMSKFTGSNLPIQLNKR